MSSNDPVTPAPAPAPIPALESTASPAPYAPRVRSVACRQCHARKSKCSGERPCSNCKRADRASECVYPSKDRRVKVSQNYLDALIAENEALLKQIARLRTDSTPHQTPSATVQDLAAQDEASASQDGTEVASSPWFVNTTVSQTPILLAEASDSAFATRLRQAMSASEQCHFPRTSYPTGQQIQRMSDADCQWPTLPEARLLVNATLQGLGREHHVVRRSAVLEDLARASQEPNGISSIQRSRLWAVFAIGKIHTTRSSSISQTFPGLEYFAKSVTVLKDMKERPIVDFVEVYLLLSYYSLCLNRRHSAYNLAGLAVRTAVIMGLHLDAPLSLSMDPTVREHRTRIWWTAYIFDRMYATKTGYPVTLRDDDISASLPSADFKDGDFFEPAYSIALINLARISGHITSSVYGKNTERVPISQRVETCLQMLRAWSEDLPTSLKLDSEANYESSHRRLSLHLQYNHLTIVATRLLLLHALRTRSAKAASNGASRVPLSASTHILCDACIRSARSSNKILLNAWINGYFVIFDYFFAQSLFSTATILALSSMVDDAGGKSDVEHFDMLNSLLTQLRDSGNFVAAEFKQHLDAIRSLFNHATAAARAGGQDSITSQGSGADPTSKALPASHVSQMTTAGTINDVMADDPEAFLYDLLAQPLPDLHFIDPSLDADSAMSFDWPPVSDLNS